MLFEQKSDVVKKSLNHAFQQAKDQMEEVLKALEIKSLPTAQFNLYATQIFCCLLEEDPCEKIKCLLPLLSMQSSKPIVTMFPELNITPVMGVVIFRTSENKKTHDANAKLFKLFAENKIDFNAQSQMTGFTALHFAVEKKDLLFVLALISYGVNPFIKNTKGKTPRQLLPYHLSDSIVIEIKRKLKQYETTFKNPHSQVEKTHKADQGCIIC